MRNALTILSLSCAALSLLSCADEDPAESDDASTLFQDASPYNRRDTEVERDAEEDADVSLPLGDFKDPCKQPSDCKSGYCIEGPEGHICSKLCGYGSDCGEGFDCSAITNTGSDRTFICTHEKTDLCKPCQQDKECDDQEDLCLTIGHHSYCAKACIADLDSGLDSCPENYHCTAFEKESRTPINAEDITDEEEVIWQCLPAIGYCKVCIDEDGDGYGEGEDCLGPDCDDQNASVHPGAKEQCDGHDNDCNGETDEGALNPPTSLECKHEGVCSKGATIACINGDWGCSYRSSLYEKTETLCDGEDNDCDGEIDEPDDLVVPELDCLTAGVCAAGSNVVCSEGDWVCQYLSSAYQAGEELSCDGIDNNCDGQVDESFDRQTDVNHCGLCNHKCNPDSSLQIAESKCEEGACQIGSCAAGYVDLDRSAVNGCEYPCTPSENPEEICDDKDNDCNGQVDEGIDKLSDVNHCGKCNNPCAADHTDASCVSGHCAYRCSEGFVDLNRDLVNAPADGSKPDGCEYECTYKSAYDDNCDGEDDDCDGDNDEDVDLTADVNHCGACNNKCNAPNADNYCFRSQCNWQCEGEGENEVCSEHLICKPGFYDIKKDEPGCEYECELTYGGTEICDYKDNDCDGEIDEDFGDLNTNVNHCGACNHKCDVPFADNTCESGQCKYTCQEGHYDHDLDELNGCEYTCFPKNKCLQDFQGKECACDGEDNDCDGEIDEGFDLLHDPENCGACGHQCKYDFATAICNNGSCQLAGCLDGHYNHNGLDSDGCEVPCTITKNGIEECDDVDNDCDGRIDEETDKTKDVHHCGGCGNDCTNVTQYPEFENQGVTCENSQCKSTGCQPGFYTINENAPCAYQCEFISAIDDNCDDTDDNCDGVPDDGIDKNNDVLHCGACNNNCSDVSQHPELAGSQFSCVSGQCHFDGCDADHYDIDALESNGCEYECIKQSDSDLPDAKGEDSNCDGYDGDLALAVFVDATQGNDTNTGLTPDQPKRTIKEALRIANARNRTQVLIAEGSYQEQVSLVNGIGLYGGYDHGFRTRSRFGNPRVAANIYKSIIQGQEGTTIPGAAVIADNINNATVQGLSLQGISTQNAGESVYGVYLRNSNNIELTYNEIRAGNGGDGINGSNGNAGNKGQSGARGTNGCGNCSSGGNGGAGGFSTTGGLQGGKGGKGGYNDDNAEAGEHGYYTSNGGAGGNKASFTCHGSGGDGGIGQDGLTGIHGDGGNGYGLLNNQLLWEGKSGVQGKQGNPGAGGGGGGGGSGTSDRKAACGTVGTACMAAHTCNPDRGGGGGGGGQGGQGGSGGQGGQGGGASFGIFIVDSEGTFIGYNAIYPGKGGKGGNGGNGGKGGEGGEGGEGGNRGDDSGPGGNGGKGGKGGTGGAGGGGSGGMSYAVARNKDATAKQNLYNAGTPGQGGLGGENGNDGQPGYQDGNTYLFTK